MIYNVLSILFLGIIIERNVGGKYILAIWLLAGSIGTLFSTQFSIPPWNIGTGASQASFGLIGFGVVLLISNIKRGYLMASAIVFALVPALYLDFKSAGYPKEGHLLSFIIGCSLAVYYYYRLKYRNVRLAQKADNA